MCPRHFPQRQHPRTKRPPRPFFNLRQRRGFLQVCLQRTCCRRDGAPLHPGLTRKMKNLFPHENLFPGATLTSLQHLWARRSSRVTTRRTTAVAALPSWLVPSWSSPRGWSSRWAPPSSPVRTARDLLLDGWLPLSSRWDNSACYGVYGCTLKERNFKAILLNLPCS